MQSRSPRDRNRKPLRAESFESRRKRHSSRISSQKIIEKLQHVAIACAGVLVIIWVIFFGRLDSTVAYSGAYSEDVQAVASAFFDQTTRLRYSFEPQSLERYLLRELPLFDSMEVTTSPFSTTVTVIGSIKEPQVLWQSAGKVYGIDKEGYIVSTGEAPQDSIPLVFDAAGLQYEPGQRLLTGEYVAFIEGVTERVQEYSESFSVVDYRAEGSIQSLTLGTEQGFVIRLSSEINPDAQLQTVNDLLQQGSVPREYVDVRVPGRVFWR